MVESILQRRPAIVRKQAGAQVSTQVLAANVDCVLLVTFGLLYPEMLAEAQRAEAIPMKRTAPPQTGYLEHDQIQTLFKNLPREFPADRNNTCSVLACCSQQVGRSKVHFPVASRPARRHS